MIAKIRSHRRHSFLIILFLLLSFPTMAAVTGRQLQVRHVGTESGLSDNQALCLLQLDSHAMAIGTWGNINFFDGGHFSHERLTDAAIYKVQNGKDQLRMSLDNHHRIWMKRYNQLWCMDYRGGCYVEHLDKVFDSWLPPRSKSDVVLNVLFDSRHQVWLCRQGRVYDVDGRRLYQLPRQVGEVVYVDGDAKHVWVFTDKGLCISYNRFSRRQLYIIRCSDAPQDSYWNVMTKSDGHGGYYQLYGGHESRLYHFSPRTRSFRLVYTASRLIRSFTVAPDGRLWLAHRAGILVLRNDGTEADKITSFSVRRGVQIENNDVSEVFFDADGNLWIAMSTEGVLYHHFCDYKLSSAPTLDELGLPFWLDEAMHSRRVPQYIDAADHSTNDDLRDHRGWIWAATSRGLMLTIPGQPVRVLGMAEGLPSDIINALAEDRQGNIWMSTAVGIAMLSVKGTAKNPSFKVTPYDITDGCLPGEYYPRNALRLNDGRIVMAGLRGWTMFDPSRIQKPWHALHPRIVSVMVNDRELHAGKNFGGITLENEPPYADEVTLRYNQNNLSFVISAFYYQHRQHTVYRWRLVHGGDSTWHVVSSYTSTSVDDDGILHLSMMQMQPGHYRLEVEAATNDSRFSTYRTSFRFTILPPWWATWWAYTLYTLLFLGLIALGVWIYVRDQRRRLEWKRQEEVLQLKIKHLLEASPATRHPVESSPAPDIPDESQPVAIESEPKDAEEEAADEAERQLSEKDNAFIQQAVSLIEKHLGDNYSVEQLASDLCMERTGLYKRLTALIDQSPQLFIRSIRLQRAADMLVNTDMSVTDIAYNTGFSSVAYLVRCFRSKYGVTPGEWRKTHS